MTTFDQYRVNLQCFDEFVQDLKLRGSDAQTLGCLEELIHRWPGLRLIYAWDLWSKQETCNHSNRTPLDTKPVFVCDSCGHMQALETKMRAEAIR